MTLTSFPGLLPSERLLPSETLLPADPVIAAGIINVRERPPLRHTVEVETPKGRRYRWATDEPDPSNVVGNLQHDSTMPGGYGQGDCVLARKPGVGYDDLERLSTVRIRDAGMETVGEYRLERTPRVSGDQMSVSPGFVGWQAHLEDDKFASFLGIDRDLSQFAAASRAWRSANLAAGYQQADGSVFPDDTSARPGLVLGFDDPGTAKAAAASTYDAGATRIGKVYYDVDAAPVTIAHDAFAWAWRLYTSDADNGSGIATSSFPGPTGYLNVPGKRYLIPEFRWDGPFATSPGPGTWELHLRLAVYGNHGLPLHGPDPGGLLASDIVAYVVARFAPLLRFTTGPGGTIQPSQFVIGHVSLRDPTTAGEILRQGARYELPDWAVWDDRTLYWNARRDRGRHWRARVGPAQLSETGPQLDRLWESIVVAYRDVDGSTRTVGPPGSGADTESADLKDYDPENPANQLGIHRRDLLQMGTNTAAGATEVGRQFLEQTKLLDSSGQATLVGHVEDDRGVLHPYSHVHAGDDVTFVDADDTQPRRIVRAQSSHADRAVHVDLDAPPEGMAALLERLSVDLVPLGI